MAVMTVTKDNFQKEVLESDKTVLLDFWASWCGPCRMLGPVIAEIAEEYEGSVKVGKVNVDEQPELANKFGVSAIRTVLLIKNGEIAATSVGYRPKEDFVAMISK